MPKSSMGRGTDGHRCQPCTSQPWPQAIPCSHGSLPLPGAVTHPSPTPCPKCYCCSPVCLRALRTLEEGRVTVVLPLARARVWTIAKTLVSAEKGGTHVSLQGSPPLDTLGLEALSNDSTPGECASRFQQLWKGTPQRPQHTCRDRTYLCFCSRVNRRLFGVVSFWSVHTLSPLCPSCAFSACSRFSFLMG